VTHVCALQGHRVGMLVDVEHSFAHFYINSVKVGSASGFPRNEYTVAISIDCVGDCVTLLPDARPPNALE